MASPCARSGKKNSVFDLRSILKKSISASSKQKQTIILKKKKDFFNFPEGQKSWGSGREHEVHEKGSDLINASIKKVKMQELYMDF